MTTTPAELIAEGKRLRISLVENEGPDDESTLYAFALWATDTAERLAAALEAAEAEREVHPEVIARVQLAMRNRERPFDSDIAALIIACGWQPDPAAGAGTSKEGAPPMSLQAIAESVGYTGDLSAPYIPTPIFFEDTGILSYIMADIPAVTRQMDTNFDLLLDMTTREPVGFNLYGAKRAFPQPTQGSSDYVLAPKTASEAMITAAINEGDNANTNLTTEEYLAIVAARAILCEEAAVLAGQLADEARSPPVLPEAVSPFAGGGEPDRG